MKSKVVVTGFCGGGENVLKLIVMVAQQFVNVQLCECAPNHGLAHFKWVTITVLELYLTKAVTQK